MHAHIILAKLHFACGNSCLFFILKYHLVILLFPRCFLFKGMASFIKWRQSRIQSLKQEWMGRCLDALRTSAEHDPHDHLVHFYLALTYALCRQVNQALTEVRMALRLRAEHLPSLLLLALLLSTASSINGSPFTSSFSDHLEYIHSISICFLQYI